MAKLVQVPDNCVNAGELKSVLALVKPALSSKDFIPIFSHICFQDDKVTSYSEPIGIEVCFENTLSGGIKGDTLLSWVGALPTTNEITFNTGTNKVKFASGRSKLELSLVSTQDFIHEKPKDNEGTLLTINDDFIKAIECCLLSVNASSDNPSMAGITVSKVDENVYFHSTNGIAISEYVIPSDSVGSFFEHTVILPAQFCNVLKKMYREISAVTCTAHIANSTILVTFNGNRKVSLWSKLLDTSKIDPLNFEAEISNALNGFDMSFTFDVNEDFIQTMHRLLNVYSTSTNEAKLVDLVTDKNELTFSVKKSNVHIDEVLTVDVRQPKISATIDLEKLASALLPGCGMAMLTNLVLVTSEQFTYLQAFKA